MVSAFFLTLFSLAALMWPAQEPHRPGSRRDAASGPFAGLRYLLLPPLKGFEDRQCGSALTISALPPDAILLSATEVWQKACMPVLTCLNEQAAGKGAFRRSTT